MTTEIEWFATKWLKGMSIKSASVCNDSVWLTLTTQDGDERAVCFNMQGSTPVFEVRTPNGDYQPVTLYTDEPGCSHLWHTRVTGPDICVMCWKEREEDD